MFNWLTRNKEQAKINKALQKQIDDLMLFNVRNMEITEKIINQLERISNGTRT